MKMTWIALTLALLAPMVHAQEAVQVQLTAIPDGWSVEGAEIVDGALYVGREQSVQFPAPEFITGGFDITLEVSHREALSDLRFEEMVYLYHDSDDLRNRICLKKHIGTNEILFSVTDSDEARPKGAEFAENWYAIRSGELDWEAGSRHTLRIVADRAAGRAALFIDGVEVSSAEGTQFPDAAGTFDLGNEDGHSQALAYFHSLSIRPPGEGAQ